MRWVPDCQSVRLAQSQSRVAATVQNAIASRWILLGRKCHREVINGVLGKADGWFLVGNAGALFRRGDEVVITE
jgi:hypothetical protein